MLANLKIICQFHAHWVHPYSVEIFWSEIYRGRLLTLITESSSRLLRIRFSAGLAMYWFPVDHFRCMKFKPLVIWIWNQNIAISTIVGTNVLIIFVYCCKYGFQTDTIIVSCWLYSADLIGWKCHVRQGHAQLSLWLVLHRKRIKTEEFKMLGNVTTLLLWVTN